jgi:hypothetical protein
MVNTGNGLRIFITCNYLPHHDWMTFISWYSIKKNLPDAKVVISCDKSKFTRTPVFEWVKKVNVDFTYTKQAGGISIFCDVMAIREWISKEIIEAKSTNVATFCTYRNGCGNFVMSDWINSLVPPFDKSEIFKKDDMTINEARVLEIWKKGLSIYSAIGES